MTGLLAELSEMPTLDDALAVDETIASAQCFPGVPPADVTHTKASDDAPQFVTDGGSDPLDLVIEGGELVTPTWRRSADIGARDGKIVAITDPDELGVAESRIDAGGAYVLPGLIDAHVHVNVSIGGVTTAGSFGDVTQAAAHGGTTTIVDFAIPETDETPTDALARKRAEADESSWTDYAFHGCVTDPDTAAAAETLIERGASTIKLFTAYQETLGLDDGEMRQALREIGAAGGLAFVHAENQSIIDQLTSQLVTAGQTGPSGLARAHPPVSETTTMWTVVSLAAEVGCPVHFVHVSTGDARTVLEYAETHDIPVYAETCPHYLALDESVYQDDDGALYTCSPPIRSSEHAEALVKMLDEGHLGSVNSDHAGFRPSDKRAAADDFTTSPMGVPGVESRNSVLYSEGVVNGPLSPGQFVALASRNMAQLLGIYPQKGSLTVGTDADITVWDPDRTDTVSDDALEGPTGYSPVSGMDLTGNPRATILRGTPVVRDESVVTSEAHGRFVQTDADPPN